MTPNYNYNETFRKELSLDDIQAIQALYGVKRKAYNKGGDKKPKKKPKQEVICKKSPSQFYRFSPKANKFLWENENELEKELRNFEEEKTKSESSDFIYKLTQYVVCNTLSKD